MSRIFVSYRRKDSASDTGRIVYHLGRRFGKKAIFNDVFDIQAGQDFHHVILDRLNQSRVLLVIIGSQWLGSADDTGRRRLDDAEDYVRLEVATALSRAGCVVIPVLINHQSLPKKEDLPPEISRLVERHAIPVRPDPDFAEDMEKLCRVVAEYVPPKRVWPRVVAAAALLFALVATAFFFGRGRDRPDVVVQAVDSSTGDRVLRPFAMKLADGRELSPSAQHLLVDTEPSAIQIKEVECPGFKLASKANPSPSVEPDGSWLISLPMVRIAKAEDGFVNFQAAIEPNLSSVKGLPDDARIWAAIKDNTIRPEEVELIIRNETEQHLDVLMYWHLPSNYELEVDEDERKAVRAKKLFRAGHTRLGPISPGGHVRFKSFALEPGYFLFCGSANGTEAKLLSGDALYKARYAVATITDLTNNGFSLQFSDTEPSDIPHP